MRICLLVLWIGLLASPSCFSQYPGTLDSTFGVNGLTRESIRGFDPARQIAVGGGDSLYVCGYSEQNFVKHFYVAKFSPDGQIDMGFGISGIAEIPLGIHGGEANDLQALPNGKVLAAGTSIEDNPFQSTDLLLVRLMQDGSLDTTFGNGGKAQVAIDSSSWERAWDIHVLSNEKILVTGSFTVGLQDDFLLMQFLSNGSLDSSFGQGGIVRHGSPFRIESAWGSALQTDGKIVLGGNHQLAPNGPLGIYAARFHPDGSLDSTFGAQGEFIYMDNMRNYWVEALAVQADGKIVMGGYATGPLIGSLLVRLNVDGSLDTAFGQAGISVTPFSTEDLFAYDLLIQPDSSLLLVGMARYGNPIDYSIAICKFDPSGSLSMGFGQNQFGVDGVGFGPLAAYGEYLKGAAFQSDGRVVVTGGYWGGFLVARFDTDLNLSTPVKWEENNQRKLYPNPVAPGGRIHVPVWEGKRGAFCLYDVNGEKVWEWKEQRGHELLLPTGLRPGLYLLREEGEFKGSGFRLLVY